MKTTDERGCTHPDHNDNENCLDRAVGCSPYCACCVGTYGILDHVVQSLEVAIAHEEDPGRRAELQSLLELSRAVWQKIAESYN